MALERALELNANLCTLIESLGGEAFRIKLTDGKVQLPEPAEPAKKSKTIKTIIEAHANTFRMCTHYYQ